MRKFLILGAGFTGMRVVRLLRHLNQAVVWTTRNGLEGSLAFDASHSTLDLLYPYIDSNTAILHSIPTLNLSGKLSEVTPEIVESLKRVMPRRVVYLSTTGVYGEVKSVDEKTAVAPETERQHLRVRAERAVKAGLWSSMILRPAAIYGPGRGVHASLRAGTFRLAADANHYVSRIHVDDLANHSLAALFSDQEGEFPVADAEPCTSREAVEYCAALMNLSMPSSVPTSDLSETRRQTVASMDRLSVNC